VWEGRDAKGEGDLFTGRAKLICVDVWEEDGEVREDRKAR